MQSRPVSGWRPGLHPLVLVLDAFPFQADLERVHYDEEVTYVGNPESSRHANPEFDTRYAINRLGLRDDERSLAAHGVGIAGRKAFTPPRW